MRLSSAAFILLLLVCSKLFSQAPIESDTIKGTFERVETEATFPGGIDEWRHFLERNLNPAVPVDNGAPCGKYTVYVQFIVDKDGRVSDIKPLTHLGYGMEQEVVRIMKESGSWDPAVMKGKPVKAYRKQPVTFMVEQEGFNIASKTPYVLYTKTDNELTIDVEDLKAENMEVTISEGTINRQVNGNFVARVTKTGRVTITVHNKKGKRKEIGAASFEVLKQPGAKDGSN
jgi:hypothetical protein